MDYEFGNIGSTKNILISLFCPNFFTKKPKAWKMSQMMSLAMHQVFEITITEVITTKMEPNSQHINVMAKTLS
jgi:hypothetical protein